MVTHVKIHILNILTFYYLHLRITVNHLRGFTINPQELAITILTSGLLSNSKLMITPEDAIKSAFDIHKRIQYHVANHQNVQFAAKIENVFEEKPPEVEHD